MSEVKLTIKEELFVNEYLCNGFNGSKAYRIVYGCENKKTSKVEAYRILKKPKIQKALEENEKGFKVLRWEMGMDRRAIMKKLKEIIFGENPMTTLSGINTLCKLTGDFKPTQHEVEIDNTSNVDISNLSENELLVLQKQLIANL